MTNFGDKGDRVAFMIQRKLLELRTKVSWSEPIGPIERLNSLSGVQTLRETQCHSDSFSFTNLEDLCRYLGT